MKLEQPEESLLFSETVVPDIFFAEYLSQMPANSVKVYLYMIFLSKYKKDIKLNDMSKKLALPLKDINDAISYLDANGLIIKKETGYIVANLQELTLHKLYKPNLTASPEKVADVAKNKARAKVIDHINNTYFQGIMGPSWYNDIDLWFTKYNFDDQVIFIINHVIDCLINDKILIKFIAKDLSGGIFNKAISTISSPESEDESLIGFFTRKAKENNRNFANPEMTLFTIIELAGATCFNSIMYDIPVPIEEYKPYLYRIIRGILKGD